jgi:hypothetical protein
MTNATAQSAPVGHDPWDAPYFGAPVYLTYPAFIAPAAPAAAATVVAPAPSPVAVAAEVSARRGWLARLFGRR